MLRATAGSGRRFLLLLVGFVAVICAFLPNATTVILVAPIIIGASLALLVIYGARVEPVDAVLRDIDWKTLVFLGATLGGNATLIGASANIVSVGICAAQGERVTFGRFMRNGGPITLVRLAIGAAYIFAMVGLALRIGRWSCLRRHCQRSEAIQLVEFKPTSGSPRRLPCLAMTVKTP